MDNKPNYPAGLPEYCYVVSPYSGCTVQIWRGENTLFGVPGQEVADVLNQRKGITRRQVAAMKGGVEHGWKSPQADPQYYTDCGRYVGPAMQ